ncbi:MAG: hypothetical protein R2795_22115 [Saprospiraceae bacterium]
MRINKELIKGVLQAEISGRWIDYLYQNSEQHIQQILVGSSLNVNINRQLSAYLYYEGTFNDAGNTLNRLNLKVVQRF